MAELEKYGTQYVDIPWRSQDELADESYQPLNEVEEKQDAVLDYSCGHFHETIHLGQLENGGITMICNHSNKDEMKEMLEKALELIKE
jgi:hypothetical protein